jgi:hypothetical protein
MRTLICTCDLCGKEVPLDKLTTIAIGVLAPNCNRQYPSSYSLTNQYVGDGKGRKCLAPVATDTCLDCVGKMGIIQDSPAPPEKESFAARLISLFSNEPEIVEWLGELANDEARSVMDR